MNDDDLRKINYKTNENKITALSVKIPASTLTIRRWLWIYCGGEGATFRSGAFPSCVSSTEYPPMQHLLLPAVLTAFTITAASAGPLNLNPTTYQGGPVAAMPYPSEPPAPVRRVAAGGFGGGFIEAIFGNG